MTSNSCSQDRIHQKIQCKKAKVVDVREKGEFKSEHIEGCHNIPLSEFDRHVDSLIKEGDLIVMCKSGMRSKKAADILKGKGFTNVEVLEGGIDTWKQHGHPVQVGQTQVWAMDRQVRMVAGSLVLLGVLLGVWVHPGFYYLSGFVGAGLVFSALTDTCGMAMLLAKMPWNR